MKNEQFKNNDSEQKKTKKDIHKSFSSKQFNNVTGSSAEEKAAEYLKSQGYRIVKRNYKVPLGEIDIVAYDGDTLCFVEVKFRKTDYFGLPREAVNYNKQRKIRMVATCFIKQYNLFDKMVRFDVVDILGDRIELIKNCF